MESFAPIEDNYICENIGIIHSKNDKSDIDSEDVIAEVGKPDNVFEGFNGRKTIIAASGLDYPVSHVKKLGELAVKANAERMRNKKSTRAKLGSLELPEVDITEQKEEPTKKRMTTEMYIGKCRFYRMNIKSWLMVSELHIRARIRTKKLISR